MDLLILVQVLADLIQVILLTLTLHSLVVVLHPVRRALPVQERVRLILQHLQMRLVQPLALSILASLVRVDLVLRLRQAPLMPLQVVQVHQALIQQLQEALALAVQVVQVHRRMPLVRPQVS